LINSSFEFGIVTLALPLILAKYNRRLLIKNKHIIYRDEEGDEISNDHPDVQGIRRY
jgi:hypothetical protein